VSSLVQARTSVVPGRFHIEYRRLQHRSAECLNRALDKFAPPGVLFRGRELWRPKRVMKPPAADNTIRSHTCSHGIETSGQDGR
jgi:hypothetical protein